jgi:hypothetical protein
MRLFEVLDMGPVEEIPRILRDIADENDDKVTVPFSSLKQKLEPFGFALGDGGSDSAEILRQLQVEYPAIASVIDTIDDKTAQITLKTDVDNPDKSDDSTMLNQPKSPTVDTMARNAARQSIDM